MKAIVFETITNRIGDKRYNSFCHKLFKFITLFMPFTELNSQTLKFVNHYKTVINLTFLEKHN